jgi:hypothetical protein
MTEILTESFCERCGTRYTFESARPKTRLKSVKVLSRGLKNFVLSDDTSIDEAMAAARSETDREVTAHQLDAFHKTFNFCMSCRQYTCPNCWNEPEARCLSCAPLALPAEPVRLEDLAAFGEGGLIGDTGLIGEVAAGNGAPAHEHRGWPEAIEATAETTEAPIAADAALASEAAAEEAFIEPAGLEPVSEPLAVNNVAEVAPVEADAAQKAAAQTSGLLRRFRPGQNLDAELDAYERERSQTAGSGTAAEATVAESASAEPGVEPIDTSPATVEVEPVAEAASVESPAAAETGQPTTEPEPEPQPLAAAAAADVVEQPTWRISAPDASGAAPLPPTAEPGGPVPVQATAAEPADATGEPQWPARPQWPGASPTAGLPFLGRPATGQGGIEALWAASNQELITAPPPAGRAATSSIQPCVSCGLSLSATARFCRRCGTLQAR